MGLIASRLERKTARMEEFLSLIIETLGNFIGNYIEVSDIVQFFDNPEVVSRCETTLQRHIVARKRAFRVQLARYQENVENCQCHACTARAMYNFDESQNSWLCLDELLQTMCVDETMQVEVDIMMGILRDFYSTVQFNLKICSRHKDKTSVIRKVIEEELLHPLKRLCEKSKFRQKRTEPPSVSHDIGSVSQQGFSMARSPSKVEASAGDTSRKTRLSLPQKLMQELQEVKQRGLTPECVIIGDAATTRKEVPTARKETATARKEAVTAQEEPNEYMVKIVKKGGIYTPINTENLPEALKRVLKRLEDAARNEADEEMPSSSKDPLPLKMQKPEFRKPDSIAVVTPQERNPITVPPQPTPRKFRMISQQRTQPQEAQQAMENLPISQHQSTPFKASRMRVTKPDPDSIHLDDLIAMGTAKQQKPEPIDIALKLGKGRWTRVFPEAKLKSDEKPPKISYGDDDDKIFQLEDLMKAKQPTRDSQRSVLTLRETVRSMLTSQESVPTPKKTQKEEKIKSQKEEKSEIKKEEKSETKKEEKIVTQKEEKSVTKKEKKSETKKEKKSEVQKEKKGEIQKEKKSEIQKEKKSETKKEKISEPQKEKKSEIQKEKKSEPQKEKKSEPQKEKKRETKKEKKSEPQKSLEDPNLPSSSKPTAQYYPQDSKSKITYDEKDLEDVDLSEASYEYGYEYSEGDDKETDIYGEEIGGSSE